MKDNGSHEPNLPLTLYDNIGQSSKPATKIYNRLNESKQPYFDAHKKFKVSRNDRAVKCAVLQHGRSWVQAPAQAIGSSPGSDLDGTNDCGYMSDGCKYVGQSGLAAMPYTRLYSVHLYWWKRQVSHQT